VRIAQLLQQQQSMGQATYHGHKDRAGAGTTQQHLMHLRGPPAPHRLRSRSFDSEDGTGRADDLWALRPLSEGVVS